MKIEKKLGKFDNFVYEGAVFTEISHFFHPAAKLLIVVIPCKISELYTSEIIMLIKWPYMATWYAKGQAIFPRRFLRN